ncbi:hypothetical protein [Brevibacillus sp. AY1]|uniref:hypothetical protein n=1 Tax=Brevibacillus sp. AY1 TaxID=2807621 RepID=UPI00245501BE|nr:hypothetical protein [Brevibacillus sp. AY1]MDH4616407.1 hypothetical protein [Brevibacillus sp. AY1]
MDLNQRLHDLGAERRHEALSDREQLERMKKAVQSKIPPRMNVRRWMPMPVVISMMLVCFGSWVHFSGEPGEQESPPSASHVPSLTPVPPPTEPLPGEAMNTTEANTPYVRDERLSFASDFLDLVERYTSYEIKQVTASPFAEVFQATDQAIMLETNKGKVHIVFFPNPGEAEKVEIDEDFTVRGQVTYTFTGAELNEGAVPIHANGPTFQYSYDNLLFLSNNSEFVLTFRNAFTTFETYKSIFANFDLNLDEYVHLNEFKQQKIKASPQDIDQNSALAIHRLNSLWWAHPKLRGETYVPKVGDRKPGVFVKKGTTDDVLSIYASADGTHHLFRLKWDSENKLWTPVDHQQKPWKSKQSS